MAGGGDRVTEAGYAKDKGGKTLIIPVTGVLRHVWKVEVERTSTGCCVCESSNWHNPQDVISLSRDKVCQLLALA